MAVFSSIYYFVTKEITDIFLYYRCCLYLEILFMLLLLQNYGSY